MWTEFERLAALRAYDVLDSDTVEVFDDFVQIAADVCRTTTALVSFVDENRQWFAAETGLGVRETPLEMSVCAHAIRQPGPLVVPDLSVDARFKDNPLVSGTPGYRFYGGALLETDDGFPLGTICVLDDKPRPGGLTERQLSTLQALSRQVMTQLELRRAVKRRNELLAENSTLMASMQDAIDSRDVASALKDVLMLETNHRVKNTLQTVQSLLMLQARASADEASAQPLREAAGRLRTFGLMHEQLYKARAGTEMDISAYLRALLADYETASAALLVGRTLVFDGQPALWPSSALPNVGLVLLELVTNALKYGQGTVTVSLTQSGKECVLSVCDEGQDLPADFDPNRSKGFGMRIVSGLLPAIGQGRLQIERSVHGTCFKVNLNPPAA